jgi:YD repeat-containing protein
MQINKLFRCNSLDKWGRWLDKTDALGQTTTYTRDDAGNLLQRTYPDGSYDVYTYDPNQNLLSATQGDATQTQTTWYTYETSFNQIKTKTDAAGNVTTYIYDYEENAGSVSNLIRIEYPQVEDEAGATVTPTETFSYTGSGQIASVTDAQGTVTRYVYTQGTADEAAGGDNARFATGVTPVPGLLTQVIKDEWGSSETTTYTDFDAAGNPGTVTGPGCCGGGPVVYYTYDTLGWVLTKTDALGIVTKYEYDPSASLRTGSGNLIRKIDDYTADGTTGRNIVTDYTYDAQDHLLKQRTTADGIVYETTMTYDENGKLSTKQDANGQTTTYTYNETTGQLLQISYADGKTVHFTYDRVGNLSGYSDGTTSATYTYDVLNRKIAETVNYPGFSKTFRYTYYANGQKQTFTMPDGPTIKNEK